MSFALEQNLWVVPTSTWMRIKTVSELYVSLVPPHLEYADAVWSLHLQKYQEPVMGSWKYIAKLKFFAGRFCIKY